MKLSASIIYQSLSKHFEVFCTGHIKEALSLDPPVLYDGQDNEKGCLLDTCLDGQDTFRKLPDLFDIEV